MEVTDHKRSEMSRAVIACIPAGSSKDFVVTTLGRPWRKDFPNKLAQSPVGEAEAWVYPLCSVKSQDGEVMELELRVRFDGAGKVIGIEEIGE